MESWEGRWGEREAGKGEKGKERKGGKERKRGEAWHTKP